MGRQGSLFYIIILPNWNTAKSLESHCVFLCFVIDHKCSSVGRKVSNLEEEDEDGCVEEENVKGGGVIYRSTTTTTTRTSASKRCALPIIIIIIIIIINTQQQTFVSCVVFCV